MTREQAQQAVEAIVLDLSDRRGIGHEWFQIDEDIQDEIRSEWVELVLKAAE